MTVICCTREYVRMFPIAIFWLADYRPRKDKSAKSGKSVSGGHVEGEPIVLAVVDHRDKYQGQERKPRFRKAD
jgi:hypothetical protein